MVEACFSWGCAVHQLSCVNLVLAVYSWSTQPWLMLMYCTIIGSHWISDSHIVHPWHSREKSQMKSNSHHFGPFWNISKDFWVIGFMSYWINPEGHNASSHQEESWYLLMFHLVTHWGNKLKWSHTLVWNQLGIFSYKWYSPKLSIISMSALNFFSLDIP